MQKYQEEVLYPIQAINRAKALASSLRADAEYAIADQSQLCERHAAAPATARTSNALREFRITSRLSKQLLAGIWVAADRIGGSARPADPEST